MISRRIRLRLGLIAFALAALGSASAAQGAYLTLGTSNLSNATTTLYGSTTGPELLVKNANGSVASAFGLYGLLTATSPTVASAAVRGQNSSTNGFGYGVWGSQAGSGTGVYGFTPSGRGLWGNTTSGIGVRGQSTSGIGVSGQHTATTGTAPGVSASTNSRDAGADALVATVTPIYPGAASAAVRGQNNGISTAGYGVWGSHAGSGVGVQGTTLSGTGVYGATSGLGKGVYGRSTSGVGVEGYSVNGYGGWFDGANGVYANAHDSTGDGGVFAGRTGVAGFGTSGTGVYGHSTSAVGIHGASSYSYGVQGSSQQSDGVHGEGYLSGVAGASPSGDGIYGETTSGYAGYFVGNVGITGTCTGCTGPSSLQIDHPLDPAHKYLQHSGVASSDQLDLYSGNVVTDGRGFATVLLPRWFQALNRSFRYQLTIVGRSFARAIVWKEIAHNRFTIRTDQPQVKVSWLVTGIRHDRYANKHRGPVEVQKPTKEQGKYLHPELYGKPKAEGIGYHKARRARAPARPSQRR